VRDSEARRTTAVDQWDRDLRTSASRKTTCGAATVSAAVSLAEMRVSERGTRIADASPPSSAAWSSGRASSDRARHSEMVAIATSAAKRLPPAVCGTRSPPAERTPPSTNRAFFGVRLPAAPPPRRPAVDNSVAAQLTRSKKMRFCRYHTPLTSRGLYRGSASDSPPAPAAQPVQQKHQH
jgi:hypothetical protein